MSNTKMESSLQADVEKQDPPNAEDESLDTKKSRNFWMSLVSLMLLSFVAAIDTSIISTALPQIVISLKGSTIQGFWAGISFLLLSAITMPLYGSLSELFGRKPLFYIAIMSFSIGSLVAALAINMPMLITGRFIQGSGGGGLTLLTAVILTDMTSLSERGKYLSFIALSWALGTVTGPILGGVFSQHSTWRWCFWINFPFIGVALPPFVFALKLKKDKSHFLTKLRKVDWLGAAIFVGSMSSFLIAFTWGGIQYSWDSWQTLVPLILGIAGLVVFVFVETHVNNPLIPVRFFKRRTTSITYYAAFTYGTIFGGFLYLISLWFEAVKLESPTKAGLSLLPLSLTVAPSGVAVALTITKTGNYKTPTILSWMIVAMGIGLCIHLDVYSSTVEWVFFLIIAGIGCGMIVAASMITVQASVDGVDQGLASSVHLFMRTFGQAVGVALGTLVFSNEFSKRLLTLENPLDLTAQQALAFIAILRTNLLEPTQILAVKQIYADAIRVFFVVITPICGTCLVASFFLQHYTIRTPIRSKQAFVHNHTNEKSAV